MFHFDRGIKLTKADLAVDCTRRQPRAFISHAHTDHMARHEYAICTPETARLYQFRLGERPVLHLPYRKPIEWGGLRLTTYPAGHCLGAAMLLAEDGDRSLLYTGDFKLSASATAEQCELPQADVLVMECTYGRPNYRREHRDQTIDRLISAVRTVLDRDIPPVILAYSLGKAQEVTRILTLAGIPVLQHPDVHAISVLYEAMGTSLGDFQKYPGRWIPGHAIVAPPRFHKAKPLPGLKKCYQIAVTGWAADSPTRFRWGVDEGIPLSDHADYDELFECVRRVAPKKIYCTHGPASFVDRLCEAGFNAYPLGMPAGQQLRLF